MIQSLSWCSHCDPNDALEKRAWRRRIGLREQVLNLRVFCISSQSHRFWFHCCTHDVPLALTLLMTHHFNATSANVSCARLRQASAPLLILVRRVSVPSVGTFACGKSSLLWFGFRTFGFLTWCHRAKRISLSTLAAFDFDVTSGGGTGGSWWTVSTRVYCGVNEQLVSRDTGQKRKILKRSTRRFSSANVPVRGGRGKDGTKN